MAVVIEKDSNGEFHFVDNVTDMHKNLINKANHKIKDISKDNAEVNYDIVNSGNEDTDPPETDDKNELKETNDESMNVAVNSNAEIINETDNKDAEFLEAHEGIQLNKKSVSKIMALLETTISDICTENEYKLICLMEEQLQNEAKKKEKTSDNANSDEVIYDQDDGTIYYNMRQLLDYFKNISGEGSPSNPMWVPRCVWDGYTQDVVHNTESQETNSST